MDALDQEPPERDGAEQAFEALREEVAALRRGIELVYRQGQQTEPAVPDYSPTLGAMAKELKAIAGWLAALERAPAMTMTPASYEAEIAGMAQNAARTVSQPFMATLDQAREMTRALEALAGRVHERQEQRRWLATVGVIGVMGGVLLWFVLIVLLPWGAGDWLAALPLGGGRWQAGAALMQRDSPASFDKVARLYKACGAQPVELCEAAIAVGAAEKAGLAIPPAPPRAATEGTTSPRGKARR